MLPICIVNMALLERAAHFLLPRVVKLIVTVNERKITFALGLKVLDLLWCNAAPGQRSAIEGEHDIEFGDTHQCL